MRPDCEAAMWTTVRPRPLNLAAPVRACAWRFTRSRHGDGRPGQDLRRRGPFVLAPGELPDYRPRCSSSCPLQPPRQARAFLGENRPSSTRFSAAAAARQTITPRCWRPFSKLAGEQRALGGDCTGTGHRRGVAGAAGSTAVRLVARLAPTPPQTVHFVRDRASTQIGAAK